MHDLPSILWKYSLAKRSGNLLSYLGRNHCNTNYFGKWKQNAFSFLVPSYLSDNEATGHAKTGLGAKMAGDHDTQARLREAVFGRARIDDLINHYHGATPVGLSRLHCVKVGKQSKCILTHTQQNTTQLFHQTHGNQTRNRLSRDKTKSPNQHPHKQISPDSASTHTTYWQ